MYKEIRELVGKTFTSVRNIDSERLQFEGDEGDYTFFHNQDCCESVYIEDVCGDLLDLVGTPILAAEEVSEDREKLNESDEDYQWTFYKFSTIKGSVTVRWYGSSNGYYSTSVTFDSL